MPSVFLAYANSETHPLLNLREEDDKVNATLSERVRRGDFQLVREQYATIEKLAAQLPTYSDNIEVFLYSGHAGSDSLLLEDRKAHAVGIAAILAQCPKLKLVVLNGCSTAGQVTALQNAGVPVVIATSAPVEDTSATLFSITFFRALALQNSSVSEAFNLGLAAAKMKNSNISSRAIGEIVSNANNDFWAIYTKEGCEAIIDEWRLPSNTISERKPFTPNVLLIDKALQGLAQYNVEVQEIIRQETVGLEVSILDKREIVLKCYPHPVSEQLRKLMVPERSNTGAIFYDKIGAPRLQQLIVAYNTTTILLAYVLLAQLWNEQTANTALKISDEQKVTLRHFFKLSHTERQEYNFIELLRLIRQIFDDNNIAYFIGEIQNFNHQLAAAQSAIFEAFDFFEMLKKRQSKTNDSDLAFLCEKAEKQLSTLLYELGFIAKYEMASVKNITVLKYRHLTKAIFKHQLIKLEQRLGGLAATDIAYDKFLDASSILFQRKAISPLEYVNLTPLIIDENAYNERADLAKLHFFERFEPINGAYFFRHIYNPEDRLLELSGEMENKPFFNLINAQFQAFSKSFFNTPMNQI